MQLQQSYANHIGYTHTYFVCSYTYKIQDIQKITIIFAPANA